MRTRLVLVIAVSCGLLLAGCSSSSKSSDNGNRNSTTTNAKNFHVETPDGQVSLSLDGQLPPNWPSNFPIPSGATPAGSGSLVNGGSGVMIGVYTTSQAASDVFNFYKTNSSLTVTSSTSAGAGSAFVGTVKLGGSYDGSSVVAEATGNSSTNIVITLKSSSVATTTTT